MFSLGMINQDLAKMFEEMALMWELEGVEWKPRAYENAARGVAELSEDVRDIYKREGVKGLDKIPGVGKGIAWHIEEFLKTGKIEKYERLRKKYPRELLELMEVEGLGPKRVVKLVREMKINSLGELKRAAEKGLIRELPGFDAKTEKNILTALSFHQSSKGRMLISSALTLAEEVIEYLKKRVKVQKIDYAGSLRRMKETIGDIDLLAVADAKELMDVFVKMPKVQRVLAKGSTKSSVLLREGVSVDVRVLPAESYGAALQYFTGSKEHNIALRNLALDKGLKLSEYGLFERKSEKLVAGKSEEEVYKKLGLEWIPPELRENRGEIEAAKKKKIPKLIDLKDIKGDLQMHTVYSDGRNSVKEMAEKAERLGYGYIAITDHSKSQRIANGMSVDRLRKQWKEINKVQKGVNIRILKGAEVDILPDGSLDYPNKILKELDIVLASIHSRFKSSEREMTKRIVAALENEYVNILTHPSGRLLNRREPYKVDFDELFETAKKNKKIVEINGHPERLDLNDALILKAKKFGLKFSVSTDSHAVQNLDFMKYGVGQARRGWLERKDVVNTYSLSQFKKVVRI